MNDTSTKLLVVLCTLLSVVSVVSVAYLAMSDEPDQLTDSRYNIYRGMADRPDSEIEAVEEHMKTLITDSGYGYTLEHECGGYVVDGHVFTDRVTLKYIVINADRDRIIPMIETIKADHGIAAVFLEEQHIRASFI